MGTTRALPHLMMVARRLADYESALPGAPWRALPLLRPGSRAASLASSRTDSRTCRSSEIYRHHQGLNRIRHRWDRSLGEEGSGWDYELVAADRDLLFLSYSHDDREWLRRFRIMLQPLVDNRRLSLWADEQVVAGQRWRPEIEAAIARAALAVLLVSPEFLASRFILDQELPALIRHQVRLVPVLVRDCLWQEVPLLAEVQWAHDPGRDGPLDTGPLTAGERDGRIVQICRRLLELLPADTAAPSRPSTPTAAGEEVVAGGSSVVLTRSAAPGPMDGVPPLPDYYVPRPELSALRASVLAAGPGAVGVTGGVAGVGLSGQGGIGKSVLAAALAADPGTAAFFPDGVWWVSVGEHADLVGVQRDLLARLGVPSPAVRSVPGGVAALRAALAERQCLLVVDDVWSAEAAAAFRVTGPRGRVLYTGRDPAVLADVGAQITTVDVLPAAEARALLAGLVGIPVAALPAEADRVVAATGRVALALALAGAAVRGGSSWAQVAGGLDRGTATYLDHPYANTFKALQTAVAALPEPLAAGYRSLVVYPADAHIPLPAVARYWRWLYGWDRPQTTAELQRLADRRLLTLTGQALSLHDQAHTYLLLQADDLAGLHAALLAAYRQLLPADDDRWYRLPLEEPYIWDHLLHHLRGADRLDELLATATDLAYLTTRMFLASAYAAETDLAQAAATAPGRQDVRWLQHRLAQSGHMFIGLPSLRDLAATVAGWMPDAPPSLDPGLLTPLLPAFYLQLVWGLIPPPMLQRVLTGHADQATAVAFSPDGSLLAIGSADGTVQLWNPATGQLVATLTGHTSSVNAVAFGPDGSLLATGSKDMVRLWEIATAQPHGPPLTGYVYSHTVTWMAFSPDGSLLATVGRDIRGKKEMVRLWNPATGQLVATLTGLGRQLSVMAFSPDGSLLATGSADGRVQLWNPATGQLVTKLTAHASSPKGGVTAVAFSPDGSQLATAGLDKHRETVRLWNPATGQLVATLTGRANQMPPLWASPPVTAVAFAPDGSLLAVVRIGKEDMVRLWNPASRQVATLTGHTDGVRALAFAPDGSLLATGSKDTTVRLWNPASGQLMTILTGWPDALHAVPSVIGRRTHTGGVTAVAFAPDGSLLATAGRDAAPLSSADSDEGTVRLWNPASGQLMTTLTGWPGTRGAWDATSVRAFVRAIRKPTHTSRVIAVAFAPDGSLLATGSREMVRLWNPVSRRLVATLTSHAGGVTAVAFSPDGSLLATGSADGTVRLWNPAMGQLVATLTGHTRRVTAVGFSLDGLLLASASDDETIRLWNPKAKVAVSSFRADDVITALAWGKPGIAAAAGSRVFTLRVVTRPPRRDSP